MTDEPEVADHLGAEEADPRTLLREIQYEAAALRRIFGEDYCASPQEIAKRLMLLTTEQRAAVVRKAYRTLVDLGIPRLMMTDGKGPADYPPTLTRLNQLRDSDLNPDYLDRIAKEAEDQGADQYVLHPDPIRSEATPPTTVPTIEDVTDPVERAFLEEGRDLIRQGRVEKIRPTPPELPPSPAPGEQPGSGSG